MKMVGMSDVAEHRDQRRSRPRPLFEDDRRPRAGCLHVLVVRWRLQTPSSISAILCVGSSRWEGLRSTRARRQLRERTIELSASMNDVVGVDRDPRPRTGPRRSPGCSRRPKTTSWRSTRSPPSTGATYGRRMKVSRVWSAHRESFLGWDRSGASLAGPQIGSCGLVFDAAAAHGPISGMQRPAPVVAASGGGRQSALRLVVGVVDPRAKRRIWGWCLPRSCCPV